MEIQKIKQYTINQEDTEVGKSLVKLDDYINVL